MSLSRRRFCVSLASLAAGLASSAFGSAPAQAAPDETALPGVSEAIRSLELYIEQHPGIFSWAAHNELRHLYGPVSEQRSMRHVDIILAYAPMDAYMLDILSEWQLEHDPDLAAIHLLDKVERHSTLLHLRAACCVKVGDIYAARGDQREAQQWYQHVIALGAEHSRRAPALRRYSLLAAYRRRAAA